MPPTKPGPTSPITALPGMASASAMPTCAAMIQKPTWRTWRATAALLSSAKFWVITGPNMGSKMVFSFCGRLATCCAT